MREERVTLTCDLCKRSETFGSREPGDWRSLVVQFKGAPYPEFEGDLCPECVEKVAGQFLRVRPGLEAKALLESEHK